MAPSASSSRMVTSSRRAGRITNKTRLLIYRGTSQVDLAAAETIVWDQEPASSSDPEKHQPVGAKGVDSSELLEHHLQAALSSASLLHSRSTTKPSSPTQPSARKSDAAAPAAAASTSTLNYHIPTPDATGLIQTADYAKLYQTTRWSEPTNYIKFSDTVEESSLGQGGLGYCMDDEDVEWLKNFNGKAEGGSGELSPLREKENIPLSAGRERRTKGKDKEKEVPAALSISEDMFEYVMGVLEKWTEDNLPKLHIDISAMPTFQTVEHMFSNPVSATFYPSHEVPRDLPDSKTLLRTARIIFPHWKERKEQREGKTICPSLNYDESNDNDPYVCFRRRDIRATRKTRRTDNYSVEKLQKLQFELRSAHQLAQMVVRREMEKKALYKSEKEVWEAKWKLYETKRRWPSLGMSKEEEEIITGKQLAVMTSSSQLNMGMLMGNVLHPQSANVPLRKRTDREKEDRDRRDRAQEQQRAQEKAAPSRYFAPEEIKARMLVLRQKLEEQLAQRKELDSQWDDQTDSSYQPLPSPASVHAYRPITSLDPFHRSDGSDEDEPVKQASFRLRRGRGGIIRLDRRQPVFSARRGPMPSSPSKLSSWLFPQRPYLQDNSKRRPKSIDDVPASPESTDDEEQTSKRRKLDELWRYDTTCGGCTGVGIGAADESDRIVVDDLDPKYIRSRINLLQAEDLDKLRPDLSALKEAWMSMDIPPELPPAPIFMRPAVNPAQTLAAQQQLAQQQQLIQQQQAMEYQRFQMMAQQQAAMQQQAAVMAQAQQQMQAAQLAQQQAAGQTPASQSTPQSQANGLPQSVPTVRIPSDASHSTPNQSNNTPSSANAMLPPTGTNRPNIKRPPSQAGQHSTPTSSNANMPPPAGTPQARASLSPNNAMHMMQLNGQSPQVGNNLLLANGMQNMQNLTNGMMMPNGQPLKFPNGAQMPTDPVVQQQLLATIRAQAVAQARQQAQANGNMQAANGLELDPNGAGLQMNGNHLANLQAAQLKGGNFQLPNGMSFPNGAAAAAAFANAANAINGTPAANGHAPAVNSSPTVTIDPNAPIRIPSGYEGNKIPPVFPNAASYEAIARAAQASGFPSVKAYVESRQKKKAQLAAAQAAAAAVVNAGGNAPNGNQAQAVAAAAALAVAQQQQSQGQQATNQQLVAAMAAAQQSQGAANGGANGNGNANGAGGPGVQGQGTGQNFDGSPLPPSNMQLRLPAKATNKLNQNQTTPQQTAQRA